MKILNIILMMVFCPSCEPKAILSEKDEDLARAKMEAKNIWILLEDYRVDNGHFPGSLSEIGTKEVSNSNKWKYDPESYMIIQSNDITLSKQIILRSDGKIITK